MYDEAQDALAAEYVLGTLSSDEREHAEALRDIDPGFAESVRLWERRLGELNVMVEAVEPPPAVWEKINAAIGDMAPPDTASPTLATMSDPAETRPFITDEAPIPVISADQPVAESAPAMPAASQLSDTLSDSITASLAKTLDQPPAEPMRATAEPSSDAESDNVVQLTHRVRKWRNTAIAMQAIAALLAIYVVAAQFYPGLTASRSRTGTQQTAAQGPAQLAARLVAVLQHDPTTPAFLLTVDPQSRTLVVRRVSAKPEQGRSYELWLVAKGVSAPKSLGVVGQDEFTQRTIPGSFDLPTLRSASYAVSLEPAGGSTSGAPTGPILFTGTIVDSVPSAPRT